MDRISSLVVNVCCYTARTSRKSVQPLTGSEVSYVFHWQRRVWLQLKTTRFVSRSLCKSLRINVAFSHADIFRAHIHTEALGVFCFFLSCHDSRHLWSWGWGGCEGIPDSSHLQLSAHITECGWKSHSVTQSLCDSISVQKVFQFFPLPLHMQVLASFLWENGAANTPTCTWSERAFENVETQFEYFNTYRIYMWFFLIIFYSNLL